VPPFVTANTFCTLHKAWFKHHTCTEVYIDAINYATKYTTKLKARFSYCDQIKFNEPVLNPGGEEQHIANHSLLMSPSWKTSYYLTKIKLKSNCKHVPINGIVHAQNKCEIRKCFTYWAGDRKKYNAPHKSFQKRWITVL